MSMTKQELFDRTVTHLASQDFEQSLLSASVNSICAYRGLNGLKCAVGWIIPDELYNEELEGKSIMQGRLRDILVPIVGESNLPFLHSLQIVHDSTNFASMMIRSFNLIAVSHDLSCAALIKAIEDYKIRRKLS